MVDIALNGLDFFAIFVTQENVAATFGACLSSACVVDVGAEKTLISCVEDGVSLADTRIMLAYGGDDLTRLCHWFLQQKLRAFTLKLDNYADWFKMDAIKKAICHYDFAQQGSTDVLVNLPSPDREETVHINMPNDFSRFPGLIFFHPGLLAPGYDKELMEFHALYDGASDDIYGAWSRNISKKPLKKSLTKLDGVTESSLQVRF